MSYPSPSQIEEIFTLLTSQREGFIAHLDPNITVTILGQHHAFAHTVKGLDELKAKHINPILDLLDLEKAPVQGEVLRVVGGGDSPWAAVEVKNTSTSKVGKPWAHEHAYFVHFTTEGKIDQLRGYYDTHHLNGHVAEVKK